MSDTPQGPEKGQENDLNLDNNQANDQTNESQLGDNQEKTPIEKTNDSENVKPPIESSSSALEILKSSEKFSAIDLTNLSEEQAKEILSFTASKIEDEKEAFIDNVFKSEKAENVDEEMKNFANSEIIKRRKAERDLREFKAKIQAGAKNLVSLLTPK